MNQIQKAASALGKLSAQKRREAMGEEAYLADMKVKQSKGGKNRWKNKKLDKV